MSKTTKPAAKAPETNEEFSRQMQKGYEGYEARQARIGATLDLKDLGDSERAFLATCQKIYRRDRGSITPFEEFFSGLIVRVEVGMWPTPDDVAVELGTFKENFEDARECAGKFVEAYPAKPEAGQPKEAAHAT